MTTDPQKRRTESEQDELALRVCELFVKQGLSIAQIYEHLKQDQVSINRVALYPLLQRAHKLGVLRLVPTFNQDASRRLAEKFKCDPAAITIADHTAGPASGSYVTAAAAEVVMSLIENHAQEPVNLGLGPGQATLEFSRQLADRLRFSLTPKKLKLHAITAGAPATHPVFAPISFFNVFPQDRVDGYMGLFAETLVPASEYMKMRAYKDPKEKPKKPRAGIAEAFEAADDVSIVVTSMGDIRHEHDLFLQFLPKQEKAKLAKAKCVGNVQYRPYTIHGPYHEKPDDLRVVTLFELDDFIKMANFEGQKHVVLLVRSCPKCGETRARALAPLLMVQELKVWSHIVMDAATARALIHNEFDD